MDIPDSTQKAEQEIIDQARRPGKGRVDRALRRGRRHQFVAVMTVAAAAAPVGSQAAGAQIIAGPSAVAAKTVAEGGSPPATIVLTAAKQQAVPTAHITDAQWRAALVQAWKSEYARNPSRFDWWAQAGDSDKGPQCAEAESVVVHNAERALGISWVANPNVISAYHESQTWVIWRVDGDGSWKQWAIAHGRWHPGGDISNAKPGDLMVYGNPGYHIVMYAGNGYVYGADDGGDLGNHYRPAGGVDGYISMQLPTSLASSVPQTNPPAQSAGSSSGGSSSSSQAQAAAPQAQSTASQQTVAAGSVNAPVLGGGSTLSTAATPVTASVVDGGIVAPAFAPGTVGHADQFHADQPQPGQRSATPPRPRYSRHNPPPQVSASVPGTAAQRAFIAMIAPGAIAAQARYGVPASVTIAQSIEESGWGQSSLAATYHNYFGMKGKGPAGVVWLKTQEFRNGAWETVMAPFAVFHNAAESIAFHGALLHNGHYGKALGDWAQNHNADQFADDLTGVYATDPQYGSHLINYMKLYNLYQFDHMSAASGPSAQANAGSATSPGSRSNPVLPGANPGQPGASVQAPQGPVPGQLSAPELAPPGNTPVVAAPGPGGTVGGVDAPGLGTSTLSAQPTGSGTVTVETVAYVTHMAVPWQKPNLPWNKPNVEPAPSGPPHPPRHLHPSWNNVHGPAPAGPVSPRTPSGPPSAQLVSYRRPALPPPTGEPRSLRLVNPPGLHRKNGQRFLDRGFKAEIARRREELRQLSADTGVPWQIIGALALLKRPENSGMFNLSELVEWFTQLARGVGVDVTSDQLTYPQLEMAFLAYTGGVPIKDRGLTHPQLALLTRYPPGTKPL